jgi:hypothetical protein
MVAAERVVTVRHFGVANRPVCEKCKWAMHVVRRSPHPLYGNDYELQIFSCSRCGDEIKRSADAVGLPHGDDIAIVHRIR